MDNGEDKGTSVGTSQIEKVLIAVALLLMVGIVIFNVVTSFTADPGTVTYAASGGSTSRSDSATPDPSADPSTETDPSTLTDTSVDPGVTTDVTSEPEVNSYVSAGTVADTSSDAEVSSVDTASLCININTATAEELQQLNGIGPVKAAAIIEYRETNGDFVSLEELMEVKGIGEKTFEKIRDFITLS